MYDLEKQLEDLDRLSVKCQRLIRTAESVALAANLPKLVKEDVVARYKMLVEAEGGVLRKGK